VIFSKKINTILICLTIVFFIVCGVLIARINISYPKAGAISNDENNAVLWKNCEVKAVSKTLYTAEEFNRIYPDVSFYKYLLNGDYDNTYTKLVVFKVNVTNKCDSVIRYALSNTAVAEAFPSAWHNGVAPISDYKLVNAGESADLEVVALVPKSLVNDSHRVSVFNDDFHLVFSYYPDKVYLKFD
jgi:hypothetical protein